MSYFVHADDWRGIAITPQENIESVRPLLGLEAPPTLPFTRSIPATALSAAFADLLTWTDELFTGDTVDPQAIENGFAYYDADFGAIYGTVEDGFITQLYFDNTFCDCGIDFSDVMAAMERIGAEHRLIMVDWLLETVVDLVEPGTMKRYFEEM